MASQAEATAARALHVPEAPARGGQTLEEAAKSPQPHHLKKTPLGPHLSSGAKLQTALPGSCVPLTAWT